jgi:hypothetical protein
MLSTTRQQDAVRLLVLLHVAGQRPPPDPPRDDARAAILAESRVQALDFWLRNPDYLAYELLDIYDREPDPDLVDQARHLVGDGERHFPMLRHLFGAYAELDGPLMLLRTYGLVWDVRRSREMRRRRDFYLLAAGEDLLTAKLQHLPDLAWYADRARLVARVAGDRHGSALKTYQKRLKNYRDIRWGEHIAPVSDAVIRRLASLDERSAA